MPSYLDISAEIAREAGALLHGFFERRIGFELKGEFDLVTIAAILTVIGYSTNDKVVVYDRVRENLRKYKSMPLRDLIDAGWYDFRRLITIPIARRTPTGSIPEP